MSIKRELVIYIDIGLVATFSAWKEKATEQNYRYLEYVPLNSFPPRRKLLPTAIHTDHVYTLHTSKNHAGVEDRIILIYTGGNESLVKNILGENDKKTIDDLRERLRKTQMQVATLKQEVEDARSGVNKAISSMRSATKGINSGGGIPGPYRPSPFETPQDNYNYDNFDNY